MERNVFKQENSEDQKKIKNTYNYNVQCKLYSASNDRCKYIH